MPYNGNEESDFCEYQYYIEILANFTENFQIIWRLNK